MTMEITWIECGKPFEPERRSWKKKTVTGETWQDALQQAVYEIEFLSSGCKVTDIRPRVVNF